MIFVGVDPGLSGAIAFINPDQDSIQVLDMPVLWVTKSNGGKKREHEVSRIVEILQTTIGYSAPKRVAATLEIQQAMPGQGVSSMFSIGVGFGLWKGLLAALLIPTDYVRPQAWKKVMLAGCGKDKNSSFLKAHELFPGVDLGGRADQGRAEALLIAEYGRRNYHHAGS